MRGHNRRMSLGEFDLIAKYFTRPVRRAALGIGDDCALLAPAPGMQLAVSSDMLVEGRHFLSTVAPDRLGHKALAVNLSDLAACGAKPLAFTLALALPRADESFIAPLAQGLLALAELHGIELVGGDTTAGPLNLCITVMGQVPTGQALLRLGESVEARDRAAQEEIVGVRLLALLTRVVVVRRDLLQLLIARRRLVDRHLGRGDRCVAGGGRSRGFDDPGLGPFAGSRCVRCHG